MKVLIWDNRKLANIGGPSGYLFNIHEYLKTHPNPQIVFLSDVIGMDTYSSTIVQNSKKQNNLIFGIKQIVNIIWRWYHKLTPNLPEKFDLNEYDFVHVHDSRLALCFRNTHPNYTGKLIVTSHSPSPAIDEFLSSYKWLSFMRPIGIRREVQCFESADYCMFPCKEAREPYEHDAILYKSFTSHEDRMFYVPSSINDLLIDEENMQKISDLGIPNNAFVISFFGRHNEIKGYDILKKIGELLLDKYPNLYFLCGGRGEIEPLKHDRWIELGFVSNTHELLYQSDLYISANRETYFDLVVLEILRSSTKLILSNTGGNKYFKGLPNKETSGIEFFDIDNVEGLVTLVEKNISLKHTDAFKFKEYCYSNRKLFLKYFTLDKYIDRYTKAIKSLK